MISLSKNLFAAAFAPVVVAGLAFFTNTFLARTLGPAAFADFAFTIAFAAVLIIFADGGFRSILLRDSLSAGGKFIFSRTLCSAFKHLISASLILLLASLIFVDDFRLSSSVIGYVITAVSSGLILSVLRGQGDFVSSGLLSVMERAFVSGTIFCVVGFWSFFEIWVILGFWAMSSFLVIMSFLWFHRRRISLSFAGNSLSRADLGTCLYLRLDIFMLDGFGIEKSEVGGYAAAFRLVEGLLFLVSPCILLLSRSFCVFSITGVFQGSKFLKITAGILLISMFLICLISFFGQGFYSLVYGPDFSSSAETFERVGILLLLMIPNTFLTQTAIFFKFERFYLIIVCLALLLNFFGNYLLIPILGVQGAIYASLVSEIIIFFGFVGRFWLMRNC